MNEGKPKVNKPKFMIQFAIDNWFHEAVNDSEEKWAIIFSIGRPIMKINKKKRMTNTTRNRSYRSRV